MFGKELVTFILVQQQISLILQKLKKRTQPKKKQQYGFAGCTSAIIAAKQFSKILWSENNFNRFYDKALTSTIENDIDQPELSHYLRLQIESGS